MAQKKVECQRPLLVVANMVNKTSQIEEFLDAGANALSADVQFSKSSGQALCLHHGFPADFGRAWWHKGELADYLTYVDNMSTPGHHQYRGDFANILWLNLHLEDIPESTYSVCGEEFAQLLIKHAFKEESKLRLVFALQQVEHWSFMQGLHHVLQSTGRQDIIPRIAVSVNHKENFGEILQENREYQFRIWLAAEGTTIVDFFVSRADSDTAMQHRNSDQHPEVCKVFSGPHDWWCTVDPALQAGVDVVLTNNPSRTMDMVMLPEFKHKFRLADNMDDPFEKVSLHKKRPAKRAIKK